ncbi:MAG: hypothetical protein RIC84_03835 [Aggregatilineales bacterium]
MLLFDDLGAFFNQIPLALIVMVCGSGLLLFGAFAWFVYFKPQRNKRRAQASAALENEYGDDDEIAPPMPVQSVSTAQDVQPTPTFDPMDMPDLNLLVDDIQDDPPEPPKPRDPITEPEFLAHPVQAMPATPGPKQTQPITKGQKYRVKLNSGDTIFTEEIVAIMRDPRDGRLVVYHEGTGYRTLVDTPDVKKEFVAIMRELSDVVTQPDDNPPEAALDMDMMPDVEDVVEPVVETVDETPMPEPAPTPPKRTIAPPPPVGPGGTMPGDLPSFKLDDTKVEPTSKGLFGRAKFDFAAVEELDLGARIEAYLQHKLIYTPEYTGRDIHVRTAPGGGVRIQVDDNFYDAVGDVADPEVRAFLAETIQEWQDRH